jgi:hypothetical protein
LASADWVIPLCNWRERSVAGAFTSSRLNPAKLASAAALGAIPISATASDPVPQIRDATGGKGVDVAIELVGTTVTMGQAVRCLGILGRAAIVALSRESISFCPYTELINKEVEIIGVSDHLASELPSLLHYAQSGKLTFPESALRFVDLDAAQINAALDALEESTAHVRTVIIPDNRLYEQDACSPRGPRFGLQSGSRQTIEQLLVQQLFRWRKQFVDASIIEPSDPSSAVDPRVTENRTGDNVRAVCEVQNVRLPPNEMRRGICYGR